MITCPKCLKFVSINHNFRVDGECVTHIDCNKPESQRRFSEPARVTENYRIQEAGDRYDRTSGTGRGNK